MSLSSLLVQREVATRRDVEEALARQVLYGGDLLTNLFEVARPDENRLAAVLAEASALEAAAGGALAAASERALALVPPDMAKRSVFLPVSVDGDQLVVVVAEPLPSALENEISFALGVRLVQRVAPSFRILEAIARDYGITTDRRVSRLLERLASDDPEASGPRSEPLLGPELAVRAPPRAPSLHPSSPPPGPASTKPKDPRKITEQGFPAVTPEMIAAALRAQSGSQELAPPSSIVPPRTPSPPALSRPSGACAADPGRGRGAGDLADGSGGYRAGPAESRVTGARPRGHRHLTARSLRALRRSRGDRGARDGRAGHGPRAPWRRRRAVWT